MVWILCDVSITFTLRMANGQPQQIIINLFRSLIVLLVITWVYWKCDDVFRNSPAKTTATCSYKNVRQPLSVHSKKSGRYSWLYLVSLDHMSFQKKCRT